MIIDFEFFFFFLFFVEINNIGGGLALYWRNSIDLSIDTLSKNYIDAIINKGKEDSLDSTMIQSLTSILNPGTCFVN